MSEMFACAISIKEVDSVAYKYGSTHWSGLGYYLPSISSDDAGQRLI